MTIVSIAEENINTIWQRNIHACRLKSLQIKLYSLQILSSAQNDEECDATKLIVVMQLVNNWSHCVESPVADFP